jgi:hypothetical protein
MMRGTWIGLALFGTMAGLTLCSRGSLGSEQTDKATSVFPTQLTHYLAERPIHPRHSSGVSVPVRAKMSIAGLYSGPGGQVVTLSVVPAAPTAENRRWSTEEAAWGVVQTDEGRWHVLGRNLPLFRTPKGGIPAFRAEVSLGNLLLFERQRPGRPIGDDTVYRFAPQSMFQTVASLNRGLLREAKFLESSKAGHIVVVDGIGRRLQSFISSPLPDGAVEINTRYREGGFNSIWGMPNREVSGAGTYTTLWLMTGRTMGDGKLVAKVTTVPQSAPPAWTVRLISPDVSGTEQPSVVFWRSLCLELQAPVVAPRDAVDADEPVSWSVCEECAWSPGREPQISDRYITNETKHGRSLRWESDPSGRQWIVSEPRLPSLAAAMPALAVFPQGEVVSRADGSLKIFPDTEESPDVFAHRKEGA